MSNQIAVTVTEGEVRRSILAAQTHLERAAEEIVWQVQNRAWEHIGFSSWDEMREAVYGGAAVIVPRADRPELVARLRREGLSQKGIADTLGVSEGTVWNDKITFEDTDLPAARTDSLGRERPTTYTPKPAHVTTTTRTTDATRTEHDVDTTTGEIVDDAPRPLPPQRPREPVLTGERLARYDAEKRCEHFGFALGTLDLLTVPEHRARVHDAWRIGSLGATPHDRELHTPATIRRLADVLTTYANEMETDHA